MVLLTVTPANKAAITEYCKLKAVADDTESNEKWEKLAEAELGGPVDHNDLVDISKFLVMHGHKDDQRAVRREWRLDALLKGSNVYQPPPPPKPEPVR